MGEAEFELCVDFFIIFMGPFYALCAYVRRRALSGDTCAQNKKCRVFRRNSGIKHAVRRRRAAVPYAIGTASNESYGLSSLRFLSQGMLILEPLGSVMLRSVFDQFVLQLVLISLQPLSVISGSTPGASWVERANSALDGSMDLN